MLNYKKELVLITGANGFVGRALCAEAVSRGSHVSGATRTFFKPGLNKELCEQMGAKGREIMLKEFSEEKVINETLVVYAELLAI